MERIRSKPLKQACKKASVNNNIQVMVIEEMVYQYYAMIAKDIKKTDFNDPSTFMSYNLPLLGKFYASEGLLNHIIKIKNDKSKV
jgi:hypothetical protein